MQDADMEALPSQVSVATLEDLWLIWRDPKVELDWGCPFVLPPWLNAWRDVLGREEEPLIAMVRQRGEIVGIAPLMLHGERVSFLGSPNVCDYFDAIVAPGKDRSFFSPLFRYLAARGVTDFDLGPLRVDSHLLGEVSAHGPRNTSEWCTEKEDVIFELELPETWDDFLGVLDGKQRHELRRKLRRLEESGSIVFRRIDDHEKLPHSVETFIRLFAMNRADKAAFMTSQMASFFKALSLSLAQEDLLRLYFLEVDGRPVASVFCFDHQGTRYLYNNAYDDAYSSLSVGLLSKVLSIKAAIAMKLHKYNFLKGGEAYKYRLGGKSVPLSNCRLTLRRE